MGLLAVLATQEAASEAKFQGFPLQSGSIGAGARHEPKLQGNSHQRNRGPTMWHRARQIGRNQHRRPKDLRCRLGKHR